MSVENRQFFLPRVFNAPAEGVPLGIEYRRRGQKKLESWGYQVVEKVWKIGLTVCLTVLIQYRHVTDSQPPSHVVVCKYALCISASRNNHFKDICDKTLQVFHRSLSRCCCCINWLAHCAGLPAGTCIRFVRRFSLLIVYTDIITKPVTAHFNTQQVHKTFLLIDNW